MRCLSQSLFAISLSFLFLSSLTYAQPSYPERQVRLIVAFAPGGIADVIARTIGQQLGEKLHQTFVVENRTGAGGMLGARVVSGATPDGYTLLVTTSSVAINAIAMKNSIDPRTQLTPIALIAVAPMIFVAQREVKEPDLMAYARDAKKGRFTYSSAGAGTAEHLTSEFIFKAIPGLEATHVPYAGGAPAINAVMTQSVDLAAVTVPSALSLIKNNDLHVLAVASDKRLDSLPNVPTLKEAGFPGLSTASWIAMFGPAGMPSDVVDKLNHEINDTLANSGMKDKLAELGFISQPQSASAFNSSLASEVAEWQKIVATVKFAPN